MKKSIAIKLFLSAPVILFSFNTFSEEIPSIYTSVEKDICSIKIDGVEVDKYSCEDSRAPMLLSYSYLYESDRAVMVFIDKPMGNACDGGPLHVISKNNDNKYNILKSIDFCGGHYPAILSDAIKLMILIPSIDIEGTNEKIPSEKWIFKDDKLVKNR